MKLPSFFKKKNKKKSTTYKKEAVYRPAGTAAHSNSKLNHLSEKIDFWMTDTNSRKRMYFIGVFFLTCFLSLGAYVVYESRFFAIKYPGLQSTDIDLSGKWKIWFEDNEKFADPNLKDAHWCLINVPQSGIKAEANTAEGETPSTNCPKEAYPKSKMKHHTYWYRKTFQIGENFNLERPTLFLGNIKSIAWVYWDGIPIATENRERYPMFIPLKPEQIKAGQHTLSIRVQTFEEEFPGIFHTFDYKVSIIPFKNSLIAKLRGTNTDVIQPFFTSMFQLLSVMFLGFIVLRSYGFDPKTFWVMNYFGFSFLYSFSYAFGGVFESFKWGLHKFGLLGMSYSLIGIAVSTLDKKPQISLVFGRILVFLIFFNFILMCSSEIFYLEILSIFFNNIHTGTIILAPFFSMFIGLAHFALYTKKEKNKTSFAIFISSFFLHLHHSLLGLVVENRAIFIASPLFTTIMTIVIIFLSLEDYVKKEKQFSFFGRFIRPGLKRLLEDEGKHISSDEKIFRGKKIPVMKIDISGHTQSTFRMPYGMKRLYQDLWFTHMDYAVSEFVFLDKNEGDGSFYYFETLQNGGGCEAALLSALSIKEKVVRVFEKDFESKLDELIQFTPELKKPTEKFLESYFEKEKIEFHQRKTKVKIALGFGFVDEGLWGLSKQSHYDVQGDLISLTARLEKKAEAGDILMSVDFFEALILENPQLQEYLIVEEKKFNLKGIGTETAYLILGLKQEKLSKIA